MTTIAMPEILNAAIAPGMFTPIDADRYPMIVTPVSGEPRNDVTEAVRIIASRAASETRRHMEGLVEKGAITVREANRVVFSVETAVGATSHCTPGYGIFGQSSLDSDDELLKHKSPARSSLSTYGEDSSGLEHSATAPTARGYLLALLSGSPPGYGIPDMTLDADVRRQLAMVSENLSKLLAGESV